VCLGFAGSVAWLRGFFGFDSKIWLVMTHRLRITNYQFFLFNKFPTFIYSSLINACGFESYVCSKLVGITILANHSYPSTSANAGRDNRFPFWEFDMKYH
jgi:hypothetical protein